MRIAQIAPPWIPVPPKNYGHLVCAGAAPEIVMHGKTGFLVQNLDEMVQSLPGIDEIDREETRLYVEHNFSAQVMAEKYTRVYKKVMRNTS